METMTDFIFLGSKITADGDCSHEVKRRLLLGRKATTNPDSILKSRDITLLMKVGIVKAMVFPVIMYGCESWTIKKAKHWRIDAFELWCWRRQTLESPLNCKEIKPINSKGNKVWCWSWSSLAVWCENWLAGKAPDAGKDWKQEKATTEDEMFRWHHRLDGHEFEQAWGAVDGQGSLACCCTLSHKELDRTEQLNWTELIAFVSIELFFPFFFLFWAPKFPFHLFFETLNLLIALCFKSERVQSYNFYARIKILSLTFCMF